MKKIKSTIKKLIAQYKAPTPWAWRRFGDALLGVALFAPTYEIVKESHTLAIIFLFIGVVGKFATNFFAEVEQGK